MSLDLLRTSVSSITNVVDSAIALIGGLAQRLREALENNDDEAIAQLAAELDASKQSLAFAIAENTDPVGIDPAPTPAPDGESATG